MTRNGPESKQTCPACGKPAGGNFCHHCGAAMGARSCRQCGASLAATAAFCNQCGARAAGGGGAPAPKASGGGQGGRGGKGGGASRRGQGAKPAQDVTRATVAAESMAGAGPWWVAGVAMFGLILVVGWSMVRPDGPSVPPAGMGGGAVNPNAQGTTDISQMSPREAADRLYDRIMRTASAGDTAGALGFAPMAVQAFQVAEPLDLDGLFHLGMIQQLSDPEGALATARRMLEVEPDHILGLGLAGEAAAVLGDEAAARDYFTRLVRAYDAEYARTLPEYEGHRTVMPEMRAAAQAWLAR